ncbi:O-antigen ligase family protein, partial [[Clostridium] innocuum]|nr:O-antigen ligase family protein [[Clostridium] innocuum]
LVLESNIKIFSYIIITLLNRDLTLTTRTIIWEVTLNKIKEKPLIGNGYVSGQQFEAMLPHIIGVNAHNTFLMVVFTGGILLLIVFIWLYIIAQKKYEDHYLIMHIIPIVLMVMMLRAQVEGGDIIYIIYICHLIYMSPYINNVVDRRFKKLRYNFK